MRMLCQQCAQSDEIIEGSPADKTWLKFNFEIIPLVSKSLETIVLPLGYLQSAQRSTTVTVLLGNHLTRK